MYPAATLLCLFLAVTSAGASNATGCSPANFTACPECDATQVTSCSTLKKDVLCWPTSASCGNYVRLGEGCGSVESSVCSGMNGTCTTVCQNAINAWYSGCGTDSGCRQGWNNQCDMHYRKSFVTQIGCSVPAPYTNLSTGAGCLRIFSAASCASADLVAQCTQDKKDMYCLPDVGPTTRTLRNRIPINPIDRFLDPSIQQCGSYNSTACAGLGGSCSTACQDAIDAAFTSCPAARPAYFEVAQGSPSEATRLRTFARHAGIGCTAPAPICTASVCGSGYSLKNATSPCPGVSCTLDDCCDAPAPTCTALFCTVRGYILKSAPSACAGNSCTTAECCNPSTSGSASGGAGTVSLSAAATTVVVLSVSPLFSVLGL